MYRSIESPALKHIRQTNEHLHEIVRMSAKFDSAALSHEVWRNGILEGTQWASALRASILSEANLSLLMGHDLGATLGITNASKRGLESRLSRLTRSYARVFSAQDSKVENVFLSKGLASVPSWELFNHTTVLNRISVGADEEYDLTDLEETANEVAAETALGLEPLLARLGPPYVAAWSGASVALASDNPDRARHFLSSLRELFTSVMHRLAPDDEIARWTSAEDHYHQGKPKREARLQYICRGVNDRRFHDFLKADIDSMTHLYNLLNRVHAMPVHYSDDQLTVIRVRVEGALLFLLTTAETAQ
jgi:hypothetical protein